MSTQRTEAATPRRRAEARRRGNIPRSADLSSSVSLLVGLVVGAAMLPVGARQFAGYVTDLFGGLALQTGDPSGIGRLLMEGALAGARVVAPAVLAAAAAGLAVSFAQSGGLFTLKPLEPSLDRINPARGLQRLFSLRALVDTAKNLLKMAAVGLVALWAIRSSLPDLMASAGQGPSELLRTLGILAWRILGRGALALLALGGLDYLYQRFEWERGLRMTKQEVRDDYRETEGDPMIRARQRSRQRDLARRRMMNEVPRATVVITNPAHLAVALRYVPRAMAAPTVVAKGTRLVAERIRAIAMRHDVPVVENQPLARALYRSVPVGRQIPPVLYHAVAEVLAMIYRVARGREVFA